MIWWTDLCQLYWAWVSMCKLDQTQYSVTIVYLAQTRLQAYTKQQPYPNVTECQRLKMYYLWWRPETGNSFYTVVNVFLQPTRSVAALCRVSAVCRHTVPVDGLHLGHQSSYTLCCDSTVSIIILAHYCVYLSCFVVRIIFTAFVKRWACTV